MIEVEDRIQKTDVEEDIVLGFLAQYEVYRHLKKHKVLSKNSLRPEHTPQILTARDIPQIHLILENFECKKSLIKNCWIFLKKSIDTSKLFFIYVQNIWEDIIHWKYVQILI